MAQAPISIPQRLLLAAGAALVVAPCLTGPTIAQTAADDKKPAATAPAKPDANKPAEKPAEKPAAKEPDEPKAFDEVIKDTEKVGGLFTLYRTKQNALWLEVSPEMLDRLYMLQATTASGLGGRPGGVTVGDPVYDGVFSLKRVREQIFLTVRQTNYRAKPGEPVAKSVNRSFSDSVLAAFKVESQPHPDRKSVLVNVTNLFFSDLPAIVPGLTARLKTTFALDLEKSYIDLVKAYPENVEIETSYNFATGKAADVDTLPDGRSAPVRIRYSFIQLKHTGYQPRLYDGRVGYFVSAFRDLTDDDPADPFTRYILRWNLEKQDPSAALSPPKKPIVFWLDDAVPTKYREAVADGILMWNRAFERIGIKDAIVAKQIPDGPEGDAIDPFDIRYNVLRWATSPGDGYAVALFRNNPITGEILNASIRVDGSIVGLTRQRHRLEEELKGFTGVARKPDEKAAHRCEYGLQASREAAFGLAALDLMALQPEGVAPEQRERFVKEFITEVIAHEMGHILGLRHNFKASTLHGLKDLHNAELTSKMGLVSSVMDYNPPNIAPPGSKQGEFYSTTLGPYDLWAVEYGYTNWPGLTTPEAEKPYLARIASRAGNPSLAYATDEDVADIGFAPYATDPLAARFDMGADPLAFARQRAQMVRALYAKLEQTSPRPGESYQDTRRKFEMLLGAYLNTFRVAAKHIGRIHFTRARKRDPGAPSTPFSVAPAAKQREALAYIKAGLFDASAFRFSPALLNRLALDKNWHWGNPPFENPMVYSVTDRVQTMQRATLAWLFTPGLLSRLRDNEARVARPEDRFTMAELFQTLTRAVFAEVRDVRAPVSVPTMRRELQRDYLDMLIGLYLNGSGSPADAQALARLHLKGLAGDFQAAIKRSPRADIATRAHLERSLERVQRALTARAVTSS